ncbi:hypothetical protein D3273_04360 [Lichenibacterium minor]|uniref:Uncharacterized protein n=1 Tax=Lichenibacterium minor TaxID=2316528 RepID=A0A4V1RV19_9HYPH|nr:hypothetical protein [Lichenibacterium minor]RYC33114.1 hypothetical protein D3273_04360 [Lichenibacterium minor]
MTTASTTRATLRRSACLGLAGAALLGAATGASADEGGLGGFLASIFGGHPQQAAPAPQPMPSYVPRAVPTYGQERRPRARALTVRLHPAKPRLVFVQAPSKPAKVSIYEDRTLRRGDAVMTADGVRVFAGSSSWPFTAGDFVGLKDAKSFDRDTSKVLAQLDKLPRG